MTTTTMTKNLESAVHFETPTRLHVAIAVRDVKRSLPFYRTLFGQEPSKVRPGYAKFEVQDPPVNFTINGGEWPRVEQGPRHFGIQVKSTAAVESAKDRIEAGGFATWTEEQVSCCYAVQDKVWAADPDGHHWEVFVVTEAEAGSTSKTPSKTPSQARTDATATDEDCCGPSCCEEDSEVAGDREHPVDAAHIADAQDEAPCCAPSCCA